MFNNQGQIKKYLSNIFPKKICEIITIYLTYEFVIYRSRKGNLIVDNLMRMFPGSVPLLMYMDNVYGSSHYYPVSHEYMQGLLSDDFEQIDDTYFKTTTLSRPALINIKNKYMVIAPHKFNYIKEYVHEYPKDIIKLQGGLLIHTNMERTGDFTCKLKKFSSPEIIINFIKKYEPKGYEIKTVSYDEWIFISQKNHIRKLYIQNYYDRNKYQCFLMQS